MFGWTNYSLHSKPSASAIFYAEISILTTIQEIYFN